MVKMFAAILLNLIFLYSVNPQTITSSSKPIKSDRELRMLHGLVETIRYEWCMLSKKPNELGEYEELEHHHVKTITFDIAGKKIKQEPPPYFCATSMIIEASRRHERRYDDNGNLMEDAAYTLKGSLLYRTTYVHDLRGNLTELANYGPDGVLEYKWGYKFDDRDNEIERLHYGRGGVLDERRMRFYNGQGQVIEETCYKGDDSMESKTISTYEYDSNGNWIKSIDSELVTENGVSFFKPSRIDYRIITYFPDPEGVQKKRE